MCSSYTYEVSRDEVGEDMIYTLLLGPSVSIENSTKKSIIQDVHEYLKHVPLPCVLSHKLVSPCSFKSPCVCLVC